jgi:hypothetical protein
MVAVALIRGDIDASLDRSSSTISAIAGETVARIRAVNISSVIGLGDLLTDFLRGMSLSIPLTV